MPHSSGRVDPRSAACAAFLRTCAWMDLRALVAHQCSSEPPRAAHGRASRQAPARWQSARQRRPRVRACPQNRRVRWPPRDHCSTRPPHPGGATPTAARSGVAVAAMAAAVAAMAAAVAAAEVLTADAACEAGNLGAQMRKPPPTVVAAAPQKEATAESPPPPPRAAAAATACGAGRQAAGHSPRRLHAPARTRTGSPPRAPAWTPYSAAGWRTSAPALHSRCPCG